ncbi:YhjD/YihY/BrkB family envelope integrity protein [Actinoalloteichus caeruleus]|uniref:YhjD/YihY/BrkB family envelope integrity protein n=1 Tax=Actinoalloteichus cyanogriseus TaxID=2893586 RepID=UPI003AAC25C5
MGRRANRPGREGGPGDDAPGGRRGPGDRDEREEPAASGRRGSGDQEFDPLDRVFRLVGRFHRLRRRHYWLDHLVVAAERYRDSNGNHYAAAITYYSVLAIVPLLLLSFTVAGWVLAPFPAALNQFERILLDAVPADLIGGALEVAVNAASNRSSTVGVLSLLAAVYSGLGWMSNLRDALTAQWGPLRGARRSFWRTKLLDLAVLASLGAAVVLSFAMVLVGRDVAVTVLRAFNLHEFGALWPIALAVLSVALSMSATFLVFLWVISRLPRKTVALRTAVLGALAGSVGMELLRHAVALYLKVVSNSPNAAVFGSLFGLLIFCYLMSRYLLLITAWTATARENAEPVALPPPGPAVIRPVVRVSHGLGTAVLTGVVGVAVAVALNWRRRTDRR